MDTTVITAITIAMIAIIPGIFSLIQQLKKEKEVEEFKLYMERYKSHIETYQYRKTDTEDRKYQLENKTNKLCQYCKAPADYHEKTCEKCGAPL